MSKRRRTNPGFPGGCTLPEALKDQILQQTSRKRRACTLCRATPGLEIYWETCSSQIRASHRRPKMDVYSKPCAWYLGMERAFLEK